MSQQKFEPPGPVAARYIKSRGPIDLIMGPAGSGKTFGSCIKGPDLASSYFPVCRDGIIRVKVAALRTQYRDLARSLLSTWHNEMLFPEKHPFTVEYKGGIDRPVTHRLEWETIRNHSRVKVEFTMEFGAIGDANIEQFIKGYEVSAAYLNEADLFDRRALPLMWQRTGRYPPVSMIDDVEMDRVVTPYRKKLQALGVPIDDTETLLPRVAYGDFNPPDIDNYLYEDCVEKPNPLYNFFKQPGGLTAHAENRSGKPRSSYELEARTMDAHDKRRFVDGEFGYTREGDPIYPQFALDLHVADQWLKPVENLPILLGFDLGGSPACVVAQPMPDGQLRLLREICCEPGAGPVTIGRLTRDLLLTEFRGNAIAGAWIDPSGFYGADRQSGQLAAAEIVAQMLGLNIQPGPSQEPGFRIEGVRWFLEGLIDGRTPRLLVDPRCKTIIGGFVAHYMLTKQASSGSTNLLVPVKNRYSHIHDAIQYLVTGWRGRSGIINQASALGLGGNVARMQPRVARADFDVFKI